MIAAAALFLTSAPALPVVQRRTEVDTGSRVAVPERARIPDKIGQSEATRGRLVMAQFARCVVDHNVQRLESALVQSTDGSFGASGRMLATDDCLDDGQMRFQPNAMRGPVYTEVYRRRALAEAKGRRWGPTLAAIDLSATPADDAQRRHQALMAFGECVVKADPAGAKAVVIAPTTEPAQDAAIEKIAPVLASCLPAGAKITLGKAALEGVLAEVLYRGVVSTPVVAEAAK